MEVRGFAVIAFMSSASKSGAMRALGCLPRSGGARLCKGKRASRSNSKVSDALENRIHIALRTLLRLVFDTAALL